MNNNINLLSKMKLPLALAILLLPCSLARNLKFAVMSDIHIQPFYNPIVSNYYYCTFTNNTDPQDDLRADVQSESYAPLGRLFCDPPPRLANDFLEKLALEEPDLDVLLVTGDIVGHKIS